MIEEMKKKSNNVGTQSETNHIFSRNYFRTQTIVGGFFVAQACLTEYE